MLNIQNIYTNKSFFLRAEQLKFKYKTDITSKVNALSFNFKHLSFCKNFSKVNNNSLLLVILIIIILISLLVFACHQWKSDLQALTQNIHSKIEESKQLNQKVKSLEQELSTAKQTEQKLLSHVSDLQKLLDEYHQSIKQHTKDKIDLESKLKIKEYELQDKDKAIKDLTEKLESYKKQLPEK